MSELAAALALAKAGYVVSKPLGDSHRYDLVIDDGTTLSRVQVKTGRLARGSVKANCFSSHVHRGGEIEFLAIRCPQTGDTYLIPEPELVKSQMHLRVQPTVNRQDRHIRWADRYKLT